MNAVVRKSAPSGRLDFGPNVYVFSPDMPERQIRARVDSIASQQAGNQFGLQRYALLLFAAVGLLSLALLITNIS